jgi:hypothetical protein
MPPRLLAERSKLELREPLYALFRDEAPLLRDEAPTSRDEAPVPRLEAPTSREVAPRSRFPAAPVDALGPRWPADMLPAPPRS